MDPVKIKCPKCQRTYKIEEKILGKKVTCATEGCGTKFIAELPATSDTAASPETQRPTDIATISAPVPAPPPAVPEPTTSDDPFADLDLDSLDSLPPRRSSSRSDDEFDSLPPPLPTRRTAPSVPVPQEDDPAPKSGRTSKIVFAALCIAIVGMSGWIALNHFSPRRNPASASTVASMAVETADPHPQEMPPPPAVATEELIELIALTDSTLRLMRVSINPIQGRASIDEYKRLRNAFKSPSEEMAIHLELIELLLTEIHYHLYQDDPKHYLIRDPTIWEGATMKVRKIRDSQSAILRLAKLPWKATQRPELFPSTFAELRDTARDILKNGAVGIDNYPAELSSDEALELKTTLNILFASVPVPLDALTEDSGFTVPEDFDLSELTSTASQIHLRASSILNYRATMLSPSFRNRFNPSPAERRSIDFYEKSVRALRPLLE